MKIYKKWLDDDGNMLPHARAENRTTSENPSSWNNIVGIMRHKLGWHNREEFDIAQLNANKHLTNGGQYLTNDYDIEKVKKWKEESSCGIKIANTLKLSHTLGLDRSPERFSHDETNGIVSGSRYFMDHAYSAHQIEKMMDIEERWIHKDNLSIIEPNTSQTWYRFYDVGRATRYAKNPIKLVYHEGENQMMSDEVLIERIEHHAKNAFDSTDKDAAGNYHASGKVQAWIRIVGLGLDLEKVTRDMPEEGGLVEMFSNMFWEGGDEYPINDMARRLYEN